MLFSQPVRLGCGCWTHRIRRLCGHCFARYEMTTGGIDWQIESIT